MAGPRESKPYSEPLNSEGRHVGAMLLDHPEAVAFLKAIQAVPLDMLNRLVFADWLDECGMAGADKLADHHRRVARLFDLCWVASVSPNEFRFAALMYAATLHNAELGAAAADLLECGRFVHDGRHYQPERHQVERWIRAVVPLLPAWLSEGGLVMYGPWMLGEWGLGEFGRRQQACPEIDFLRANWSQTWILRPRQWGTPRLVVCVAGVPVFVVTDSGSDVIRLNFFLPWVRTAFWETRHPLAVAVREYVADLTDGFEWTPAGEWQSSPVIRDMRVDPDALPNLVRDRIRELGLLAPQPLPPMAFSVGPTMAELADDRPDALALAAAALTTAEPLPPRVRPPRRIRRRKHGPGENPG